MRKGLERRQVNFYYAFDHVLGVNCVRDRAARAPFAAPTRLGAVARVPGIQRRRRVVGQVVFSVRGSVGFKTSEIIIRAGVTELELCPDDRGIDSAMRLQAIDHGCLQLKKGFFGVAPPEGALKIMAGRADLSVTQCPLDEHPAVDRVERTRDWQRRPASRSASWLRLRCGAVGIQHCGDELSVANSCSSPQECSYVE